MAARPYCGAFDAKRLGESPTQQALIAHHETLRAYSRGEAVPPEPVIVTHAGGEKRPTDAIWRGEMLVASATMQAALSPFSGWATFPVVVHDGWGAAVPGYVGIAITGRCGAVRSNLDCVEGEGIHAQYVGQHFVHASWDGSDIFYPSNAWLLLITNHVRDALKRAYVRNLRFERLDEMRASKPSIDRLRRLKAGVYSDEFS